MHGVLAAWRGAARAMMIHSGIRRCGVTDVQYVKFNAAERQELMRSLSAMPEYLYEQFDALSAEEARLPGPGGAFSPVSRSGTSRIWSVRALAYASAACG